MFTPKFSETEQLAWEINEIERIKFRIEKMLIMPKHELWLRREAFVRTAYSSTMIENAAITEQEMEQAAKMAPVANPPKTRPDLANYYRALEFVDFLSDKRTAPDELVITQIHWFLMLGINGHSFKPGQYRTEPNWIEDRGMRVYEPPHQIDVPILMKEFSDWLVKDAGVNPIVKAGIAHLHLAAVHPFFDGNGRTARLLATLILRSGGYGFRKLLSLDAHYQRGRDEYIQALNKSVGSRFASDYDSTAWLEFFVTSVHIEASLLERKLTDWRIMVDRLHQDWVRSGLSERQMDGLIYALHTGEISRKDYVEIARVSPLTATRDLADMVRRGLLLYSGRGRNRKCVIAPSLKSKPAEGEQKAML